MLKSSRGPSDAPLSNGERVRVLADGLVSPHSTDDKVGEVAFVGSSGLAFAGFAGIVLAETVPRHNTDAFIATAAATHRHRALLTAPPPTTLTHR